MGQKSVLPWGSPGNSEHLFSGATMVLEAITYTLRKSKMAIVKSPIYRGFNGNYPYMEDFLLPSLITRGPEGKWFKVIRAFTPGD